ncbi:MAG: 4Fe-4S dicluster domain-containing protein, partial [Chloroflexi bacterium]|nr:4Fe-4S dicluster domain-containing protein [Chloroflexota bacterium]
VELIDKMMIDLTRAIPAYARQLTFIQGDPAAILVVEFYGDTESEIVSQIEKLEAKMIAHNVTKIFVRALTAQQQKDVWGVRVVGLGVLQSMRGDSKPVSFMEDVAVPVDKLGDYIRFVEKMFKEHGVDSAYYAHASAGCLHIRPVINFKNPKDIEKVRSMGKAVLGIVQQMGGAMTGEHGDGLSRSTWNGRLFGEQLYNAFGEVKRVFDPDYRFNPNKIIDAPDFMENLRHKPKMESEILRSTPSKASEPDFGRHQEMPHSKGFTTYLNFDREMGFVRAIEQCNGAGVCRKVDGTMCPSYMATRDEEHSTRGRANSLRNALSGVLPPEEFFSPRMFDVLDLCLECKACKAECPSGVDMAKIKYEYLSHYHEVHGVPLRARLFANINALSNLAHYFAPLVNFGMKLGVTRWVNEKLLGISQHRVLPPFVFKTFRDRVPTSTRSVQLPTSNIQRPSVVLFVDTFTNFNHPEIGLAALRVLEAAGFNVLMPNHGCCGRPMISKGLLWQAKEQAQKNVEVLYPFVEKGISIIGLEPSCLLTFNDEYVDLLPDDPRVKQIAAKTMLIEEFLAGANERGELKIKWKDEKRKVLVHGHCYQKAITGTAALRKMLSLPGWEVSEINSGCCGMAGSFGYEVEHFDLSMKIGGDRLFPAVKNAEANTYVVASGISCRHQIEHGTERKPLHPIELLAEGIQ